MATNITLIAPFNLTEESSSISIGLSSSYGVTASYTASTGSFFTFMSATIEDINYLNLLEEFKTRIFPLGFGTWNYGYDFSNGKFWLSGNVATKFTFNDFTSQLLGMSSAASASMYYTSSFAPKFTFKSTETNWSKESWTYEGQQIVKDEYADDGRCYSISNEDGLSWLSNIEGNYNWQDWTFVYEPKSNVYNDYSSSLAGNTYESFHRHVRSYKPFVVFQAPNNQLSASYDNRKGTYKLRAENTKFQPKFSIANYDQYFDIDIKTRLLTTGSGFDTQTSYAFSPASLGDIVAWYGPDSGFVTNSNGFVLQWNDKSGNNRHMYARTGGTGPKINPSDPMFGGYPSVFFSSSNTSMITSASFSANSTNGKLTAIFNILPLSGTTTPRFTGIFYQSNVTIPSFVLVYDSGSTNTNNNYNIQYYNNGLTTNYRTSYGVLYGPDRLISTYDSVLSGALTFYLNGTDTRTLFANAATGNTALSASTWILSNPAAWFHGAINEVIIYPRILYPYEIGLVDSYLRNKNESISDPLTLTASLEVWLDPASPHTKLNGSTVSQLGDRSGKHNHFIQSTATAQPTYIPSDPDFNGYPSLQFDSLDDAMTNQFPVIDKKQTIYIVFRSGSTPPTDGRLYAGMANSGHYMMTILNSSTNTLYGQMYNGSGTTAKRFTIPTSASIFAMNCDYMAQSGSAVTTVYSNGLATGSYANQTYPSASLLQYGQRQIGSSYGGLAPGSKIACVMEYSTTHTAAEVLSMSNWLSRKYGIR